MKRAIRSPVQDLPQCAESDAWVFIYCNAISAFGVAFASDSLLETIAFFVKRKRRAIEKGDRDRLVSISLRHRAVCVGVYKL